MAPDKRVHVCYCCNDGYFPQVMLSVLSMVRHTKSPVTVHILTADLSDIDARFTAVTEESRDILVAMMRDYDEAHEVELLDVGEGYDKHLRGGINEKNGFTPYAMFRLLVDLYDMPDRLIYLDGDTMFSGDVKELWEQDIEGCGMGACYMVLWSAWLRVLRFWRPFYINSGVILFNLPELKKSGFFETAREKIRTKKMGFPDQRVLSHYCKNKKRLPRRFNEQRKMRSDTVIRHFIGFMQFRGIPWLCIVKPHEVWRVHNVLKLHCFDDVYEQYNKYAQKFGFKELSYDKPEKK